jgi:proteasome beta subunit
VDAVGGLVPQKIAFDGSGSEIALGVLHSSYKENATVKEMIPVAVKAVQAAKDRDVYSGGKFPYVAVITKSGMKFLKEEELKQLM